MADDSGKDIYNKEPKPDNKMLGGVFKTVKKISDKFSILIGNDDKALKEARKQTRDLSLQVRITKKTIKENRFRFDKIAESNLAVAEALKSYDQVNFKAIEQVEQLLKDNQEIPAELGKQYKEAILLLNTALKPLQDQKKMMLNLGSVMDEVAKVVADRSIAGDTRASFTTDFIKLLEEQKDLSVEQKQLLELLQEEAKRGLVMNDSQTDDIGAIFELLKSNKIDDLKTTGSINSINLIASKLLMSSRNIEDKLDQDTFSMKDLLDKLEKGIGAEGLDLTDLLFAALGIPGLIKSVKSLKNFGGKITDTFKDIFGKDGFFSKAALKVKDTYKGIIQKGKNFFSIFTKKGAVGKVIAKVGSFASKIGSVFKTVGGWFSKIAKAFSPLMKVLKIGGAALGGTVLAPVVAIIGAVMGIFDAISGFFNADEISGKSEEMLTLGDKIQASISSVISGLSFGFISAEAVFKKIDEAKEFMGKMWDDAGNVISEFIDSITEFFIGEDGLFSGLKNIVTKLKDFKLTSLVPDWIADKVGMNKNEAPTQVKSNVGRFSGTPVKTQPVLSSMQTAKLKMHSEDSMPSAQAVQALGKEQTVRNNSKAKAISRIIPVPVPQAQQTRKGAIRRNQVDDMQLAAINTGLMD